MDEVASRREWYASLWGADLLVGILASAGDAMSVVAWTWLTSLGLLIATMWRTNLRRDERLIWPRSFRWVAHAMVAVAVLGVALAAVPHAARGTQWLAPFFAMIAALAWRSAVARGPSAVFLTVTVTLVTWVPFMLPLAIKCCRRRPHVEPPPPHWTEPAMFAALQITVLLAGLLAIAALVAFRPRTDELPDARAL
jgi:hypothetical protein